MTVADCVGDELPYGWEMAYHPNVGYFYVDHLRKKNQFDDPRVDWRNLQISMLNNYIQTAEGRDPKAVAGSVNSLATSHQVEPRISLSSNNFSSTRPSLTPSSGPKNPLLLNKATLEQSLADAKVRVAQLKRDLDSNYNLLTIIDTYYKKRDDDAAAVEV